MEATSDPEVIIKAVSIPEAVTEAAAIPEAVYDDFPVPEAIVKALPVPEVVKVASSSLEDIFNDSPVPEATEKSLFAPGTFSETPAGRKVASGSLRPHHVENAQTPLIWDAKLSQVWPVLEGDPFSGTQWVSPLSLALDAMCPPPGPMAPGPPPGNAVWRCLALRGGGGSIT